MEFGVSLYHLYDVRQKGLGKEDGVLLAGAGDAHLHGLGGGRRAVVHGGVGDVHSGEGAHHALVLEDVAERTL